MKIYDCFNFFNELDILELRLNILYDHVDHFVLVESDVTHSGEKKPFYFEDNKDRYGKFLDKIIHYKVYDTPTNFVNLPTTDDQELNKIFGFIPNNRWFNRTTQPDYGRDYFQKESQKRPLVNCSDGDIVMFSDADEIPNPEILGKVGELHTDTTIYTLNQNTYYYYLNVLKQRDWYGTKLSSYGRIKNHSLNDIRGDQQNTKLSNGGWHFSFMGGKEMVEKKITSYSAREMASQEIINSLENNIQNNIDPFNRGKLELVDIDGTYPKYVVDNQEKYGHLIKKI